MVREELIPMLWRLRRALSVVVLVEAEASLRATYSTDYLYLHWTNLRLVIPPYVCPIHCGVGPTNIRIHLMKPHVPSKE